MSKLLYEPENSIIKQSYAAKEIEEPLNGDGFGVGWYLPEGDGTPGVFVSVSPAWSNRNLKYISQKVKSPCIVAHVRAASVGTVAELNCHPFHFKQFLMMHNGGIEHFDRIKRAIVDRLTDPLYSWVQGQTDSEHFFALFLDNLIKISKDPNSESIAMALDQTFSEIVELMDKNEIAEPAFFNLLITDGKILVGSRFVTHKGYKPLSLHHSEHGEFVSENGVPSLLRNSNERGIIIASEKLTQNEDDWKMVPENHFVLVEEDLTVHLRAIRTVTA